MKLEKKQIKIFQEMILNWFAKNHRDLPWRDVPDGTSLEQRAYFILISEVMSQQTQISRVIPKYAAWMKRFPTIEVLAKVSVGEVLAYWSGLGYNRRALHLKKTAEIITKDFGGTFPRTEKELLTLPGVGKYTARAILCFAFNQQVAVVDTNVRKVILTQFFQIRHRESEGRGDLNKKIASPRQTRLAMTEKEIENIAEKLLPIGKAYEWNQALMDYAGSVLKKEKIEIPKQSKFIGSHRYYRGKILKVLLAKKKVNVSEIGYLIKKDYDETQKNWLERLVNELKKEGFITLRKENIFLVS